VYVKPSSRPSSPPLFLRAEDERNGWLGRWGVSLGGGGAATGKSSTETHAAHDSLRLEFAMPLGRLLRHLPVVFSLAFNEQFAFRRRPPSRPSGRAGPTPALKDFPPFVSPCAFNFLFPFSPFSLASFAPQLNQDPVFSSVSSLLPSCPSSPRTYSAVL